MVINIIHQPQNHSNAVASISGEYLSEADDVLKGLRQTQRAIKAKIAECPLREANRAISKAIVLITKGKKAAASALTQASNKKK